MLQKALTQAVAPGSGALPNPEHAKMQAALEALVGQLRAHAPAAGSSSSGSNDVSVGTIMSGRRMAGAGRDKVTTRPKMFCKVLSIRVN